MICAGFRMLHPMRNYDLRSNLLIDRSDIVATIAIVENSNDRRMRTKNRAHDSAFGTSVRADGTDFDQHPISVHRRANGRRGNEDVALNTGLQAFGWRSRVRKNETETVAVHAQSTGNEVLSRSCLRNRVTVRI